MKLFLLTISTFIFANAIAQNANQQMESIPHFNTQGEQEDWWAKKLFEQEYKKQSFQRYQGSVTILDEYTFKFGNNVLEVSNLPDGLIDIFKLGILYPAIISWGQVIENPENIVNPDSLTAGQKAIYNWIRIDSLHISGIQELGFLNPSSKVKRFRYWLHRKGIMNPIVCFFELTNEAANEKTGLPTFISGAKLTFFKQGWIAI